MDIAHRRYDAVSSKLRSEDVVPEPFLSLGGSSLRCACDASTGARSRIHDLGGSNDVCISEGGKIRAGAVSVAIVCVAAITMIPNTASADQAPSAVPSNQAAALITPLLNILEFGDSVGLPEACNTGLGAAGSSAASLESILNVIAQQCAELASEGSAQIEAAIAKSSAFAAINPLFDPMIAALASAIQTSGSNYGPTLGPFGPTVAGLGGMVSFFEGS